MRLVYGHSVAAGDGEGFDDPLALSVACQAKNAVIKRNSRTPEQAVIGRSLQWSNSVLEGDDGVHLAGHSAEGEATRATLMRATAARALYL